MLEGPSACCCALLGGLQFLAGSSQFSLDHGFLELEPGFYLIKSAIHRFFKPRPEPRNVLSAGHQRHSHRVPRPSFFPTVGLGFLNGLERVDQLCVKLIDVINSLREGLAQFFGVRGGRGAAFFWDAWMAHSSSAFLLSWAC